MKTGNKYSKEEILNSLEGIQGIDPSPFLYNRILSKIHQADTNEVTPKKVLAFAISFIIILFINIQILLKTQTNSSKEGNNIEQLAREYNPTQSNPIQYN
jgi:uncharacterized membrane protein YvbJ